MYIVNKTWSKMTKVEKRKTLAQDVISQIKAQWIKPEQGFYCSLSASVDEANLQKDLQQKGACKVCAMGSLMVASIIKTNKFYNNWWDDEDIEDRLNNVFSVPHLRLIETAFEGRVYSYLPELINKDRTDLSDIVKKAIKFGEKYKIDKNRLIAIMNNIINDENGKFLSCKF